MIKKKIKQHKMSSQMNKYLWDFKDIPVIKSPLVNMAKLKAITVILLIIAGSTFGIYYLGEWNVIGLINDSNSIILTWLVGLLTIVVGALGLIVAIGLYIIWFYK